MMQALDLLWLVKGTFQDEVTLNSEEINPVAIATIVNLVEGFMVDLKTFFSLTNTTCT